GAHPGRRGLRLRGRGAGEGRRALTALSALSARPCPPGAPPDPGGAPLRSRYRAVRGRTGSGTGPRGDPAPERTGAVEPTARGSASTPAGPVREAGHILAAATAARQTFRA